MRYERCPYGFWLADSGQIALEEIYGAHTTHLLSAGIDFEDKLVAEVPSTERPLEELFVERHQLLSVPLFENHALRIFGRPDGIATADGVLAPIEIKSHRALAPSDRLELAFYWLLLEPHRTRSIEVPYGLALLRFGDVDVPHTVTLRGVDFDRVRALVEDVRRARSEGVEPRPCRCEICAQRPEVQAVIDAAADPSLLFGISWKRARALRNIGIGTFEELLASDASVVIDGLRRQRHFVSADIVRSWQHHARAYRAGTPIRFGSEAFEHERYILLDVEYVGSGEIWLTGIHVQNGSDVQTLQFWSDTEIELRAALDTFKDVLTDYSELPVLTWSGTSADLPHLLTAARAHRLRKLPKVLSSRHVDVYSFASRNVRLPISSLSLKDVAAYCGFQPKTGVSGGLEAQMLYLEYSRARSVRKRKQLRDELLAYNNDDLMALRCVVERLRELPISDGLGPQTDPVPPIDVVTHRHTRREPLSPPGTLRYYGPHWVFTFRRGRSEYGFFLEPVASRSPDTTVFHVWRLHRLVDRGRLEVLLAAKSLGVKKADRDTLAGGVARAYLSDFAAFVDGSQRLEATIRRAVADGIVADLQVLPVWKATASDLGFGVHSEVDYYFHYVMETHAQGANNCRDPQKR